MTNSIRFLPRTPAASSFSSLSSPSAPKYFYQISIRSSRRRQPDFTLPSVVFHSRSTPALLFRPFCRMSETPFRPREQLYEKQKIFQSIHKHTYLKGPYDKITSVAIPAALAATSLFLIGRGIYNMSHGIGKKE